MKERLRVGYYYSTEKMCLFFQFWILLLILLHAQAFQKLVIIIMADFAVTFVITFTFRWYFASIIDPSENLKCLKACLVKTHGDIYLILNCVIIFLKFKMKYAWAFVGWGVAGWDFSIVADELFLRLLRIISIYFW